MGVAAGEAELLVFLVLACAGVGWGAGFGRNCSPLVYVMLLKINM